MRRRSRFRKKVAHGYPAGKTVQSAQFKTFLLPTGHESAKVLQDRQRTSPRSSGTAWRPLYRSRTCSDVVCQTCLHHLRVEKGPQKLRIIEDVLHHRLQEQGTSPSQQETTALNCLLPHPSYSLIAGLLHRRPCREVIEAFRALPDFPPSKLPRAGGLHTVLQQSKALLLSRSREHKRSNRLPPPFFS